MKPVFKLFDFNQKVDYKNEGKKLHLRHLSADCWQLLKNAADVIDVNIMEDPAYKVAADKLA